MSNQGKSSIGILVGWKHHKVSDSLVVQLQSIEPGSQETRTVDTLDVLMTKSQAMVLANYLSRIASDEVPNARGSLWQRLLRWRHSFNSHS